MRPRPTQACAAALGRAQMVHSPARDRELGMLGGVAVLDPVAVLVARRAVAVDQDGAERLVTGVKRGSREFHAAAQSFEVLVADGHRREFTQLR